MRLNEAGAGAYRSSRLVGRPLVSQYDLPSPVPATYLPRVLKPACVTQANRGSVGGGTDGGTME